MAFQGSGFPLIDVIAYDDITVADRNQFRVNAQDSVLARLQEKKIASSRQESLVRNIRPYADFAAGGVTYEHWLTGALVAGTTYLYINQALPNNQVCVFYGIGLPVPNPAISEIQFRLGPAGASSVFISNIEHIYTGENLTGYFSKVAGYDPLDQVYIQVVPFLSLPGGQEVVLRGYIGERIGATVSGPVM